MWQSILNFIVWLLGLQSETSSNVMPVTPSTTKTETTTYQEIDWLNAPPQYHKRRGVLSFHERQFYRLLRVQIGEDYHVFPMVRIADVLWLEDETEKRKFFNNQIQCKHFDYVICDKLKFEPLMVIELDDSSHQWADRWRNDEFKDKVCQVANLPLLRIKAQQTYNKAEISQQIETILQTSKDKQASL